MKRTPILAGGIIAAFGLTALANPALAAPASNASTGTTAASGRHYLQKAPAWTSHRHRIGKAPTAARISFSVSLTARDERGAEAFAADANDPGSPRYRHFITPAEFTARFGPTRAEARAVTSALRAAGLHPGALPSSRAYIPVTGTRAAVNRFFGTTISTYRLGGHTASAPDTALSVPQSLAGKVSGVLGLDSSAVYTTGVVTPPGPRVAAAGNTACSRYWGQNTNTSYAPAPGPVSGSLPNRECLTPDTLNTARGVSATGLTGAGTTVGVVLWCDSGTIASDLDQWAAQVGSPALENGQYTAHDAQFGSYCRTQANVDGAMLEVALDTEAVHGAAPAARIVYSAAAGNTTNALLAATQYLVDADQVSVISNSWGGSENGGTFLHSTYVQAAAQGISVLASSGDAGDNTYTMGSATRGRAVAGYPAAEPEITSVGGTSLGIEFDGGVRFEEPWFDAIKAYTSGGWSSLRFYSASGGGVSAISAQPSYQRGVVPSSLAGSTSPRRAYPDIANVADPKTGYLVGVTRSGTFQTLPVGGTSLASPYTAGEVALAVQRKGSRLGFLNPALYTNRATAVTDISTSAVDNAVEGPWTSHSTGQVYDPTAFYLNAETLLPSTQVSQAGWDDLTGLGAVADAGRFVAALQ